MTTHPIDATALLGLLPTRPRLLALGEPTHGADALLALRNDLFRQLVEREGYRTIALESDCLKGLAVDDYVTSGKGDLDDVMARGFSHEFGTFEGNRALVAWMREHNRTASEPVHFAGFDGPLEITAAESPRQPLTALHTYLAASCDVLPCTTETLDALLGADDRWTNPAAMMDPSQSIGQTPEANRLRLLADDLRALLDAQPVASWHRAHLYARTAIGLLRYHFWMADPSPNRMAWLVTLRDSMMAENLRALASRGPTLTNGHNGHFQRDKSSMQGVAWWGAGAIVSAELGPEYAVVATALGTLRSHDVGAPPEDTVEGFLYALPQDRYLIDPTRLPTALPPRVSPWYGYSPLNPPQLPNLDALAFVKDADRN